MGNFMEEIKVAGNPEKIKEMKKSEIRDYLLELISTGNKLEFEQLYEHFLDYSCRKYDGALELVTASKKIEWLELCSDTTNESDKYKFVNTLPTTLLKEIETVLFVFGYSVPRHVMSNEEIENREKHVQAGEKLREYMEKVKENAEALSVEPTIIDN